jgi:hypothetical protein
MDCSRNHYTNSTVVNFQVPPDCTILVTGALSSQGLSTIPRAFNPRPVIASAAKQSLFSCMAGPNPELLSRGTRDFAPRNDKLGPVIGVVERLQGQPLDSLLSVLICMAMSRALRTHEQ